MLIQFFYILLFYLIGEALSLSIGGFIPGSVIGMLLLFLALCLKKVRPARVARISRFLTKYMGMFFIPAGVGLMTTTELLSAHWLAILVITVISTVLVIVSVALIQQKIGKKNDTTSAL